MTSRTRQSAEKAEAPATAADPDSRPQAVVVRRRTPELNAHLYDGTNAVAVASWVNQQGGTCTVAFPAGANALPQLIDGTGAAMPTGVYVLGSMEAISFDEVDAQYDIVSILA